MYVCMYVCMCVYVCMYSKTVYVFQIFVMYCSNTFVSNVNEF